MGLFHSPNVITNGLVLYLDTPNPKSTTGTTWSDISGNNIPVTIVNSGTASVKNYSNYLTFNPSTYNSTATYYQITDSRVANLTSNVTLETCVYFPRYTSGDVQQQNRIVSPRIGEQASPYGFNITPNRTGTTAGISQELNTTNGWSTGEDPSVPRSVIDFNKWIHVTQVQDDTAKTLKIYANGVLRNTVNYTGTPNNGGGLLIGRGFYAGIRNATGRVGFVRLYNRPFSQAEITQNYNAMRGRFEVDNMIVDSSLKLWLDAGNPISYAGTGTSWFDLSGNNNTATLVAAPTYSGSGHFTFNGSSQYASIPSSASITTTTPTIIIACTTSAGGQTPVAKGQYGSYWNYGIHAPTTTNFRLRNNAGDTVSATYGAISGMNIFAGVWDGTNMNFYLNGNFIGQTTTNYSPVANNTGFLTIGCALNGSTPTEFFNGNIAMIQVYNRPLSAAEIKQNFNATRDRYGI